MVNIKPCHRRVKRGQNSAFEVQNPNWLGFVRANFFYVSVTEMKSEGIFRDGIGEIFAVGMTRAFFAVVTVELFL